jgi:hypothetical protein
MLVFPGKFTMSRSFTFSLVSSCILALAPFIRKQKDKYPDICVAVGFSVFLMLASFPVILTTWLHPQTFDMLLYRADLRLGLDSIRKFRAKVLQHFDLWLRRDLIRFRSRLCF